MNRLKIGNVDIPSNIILAPMAGITDATFRGICASMGCELTYTEMVSAKGMSYNNKNTAPLIEIHPDEKFKSIQLFGSEPDILAAMAKKLNDSPFDIIDINMGCPATKIVKNGDGSALMKEPDKIGRIVEAVSKASSKPVTIKIRKGFDEQTKNAVEVAKIAESAGAAAIAVHGRLRTQFYSGVADWDIIRDVKQSVKIPVIGNGDVTDLGSYLKIIDHTNCDGVMIGRAAQGNPWVFRETSEFLRTGIRPEPVTIDERFETALLHTSDIIAAKGEYIGVREMRKHLCWYVKGLKGNAEVRKEMVKLSTLDEVKQLIDGYREYFSKGPSAQGEQ